MLPPTKHGPMPFATRIFFTRILTVAFFFLISFSVKASSCSSVSEFLKPAAGIVPGSPHYQISDTALPLSPEERARKVFYFENTSLKEMLTEIGKWYKMKLVYKGEVSAERHLAIFSREDPVERILMQLTHFTGVRFTIIKDTIFVKP